VNPEPSRPTKCPRRSAPRHKWMGPIGRLRGGRSRRELPTPPATARTSAWLEACAWSQAPATPWRSSGGSTPVARDGRWPSMPGGPRNFDSRAPSSFPSMPAPPSLPARRTGGIVQRSG
jgi:hypothetical protein